MNSSLRARCVTPALLSPWDWEGGAGVNVEDLPQGKGLVSSTHLGTPFRFPPPSLPRVGVSRLGPAGPSWESGQAATSLWGWQLLGQSQLTSKPGSRLRFLMKDRGLGIDTFNCLGTVSDPMWALGMWR